MLKIFFFISRGELLIRSHYFLPEICQKLLPFLDIFRKGKSTNCFASSFNRLLIFSWCIQYFLTFIFSLQPRSLGWEGRTRYSKRAGRGQKKSTIVRLPLWSFLAKWSRIPAARKWFSDLLGAPQKFYTWKVPKGKHWVPCLRYGHCLQLIRSSCQPVNGTLVLWMTLFYTDTPLFSPGQLAAIRDLTSLETMEPGFC